MRMRFLFRSTSTVIIYDHFIFLNVQLTLVGGSYQQRKREFLLAGRGVLPSRGGIRGEASKFSGKREVLTHSCTKVDTAGT